MRQTLEAPRFMQKQLWSFHVSHVRGSLGHVRDQSNARQTQTNYVPHSKTDTIRITYPTREKSTRIRNKNRPTGHANIFTTKYQWPTHCGQKPTWWHTSSRSIVGIYTTMRINAGRTKLRGDLIVTALDRTHPTWCILALQWWNFFLIHAKKNSVCRLTSNYAILLNMLATMARPTTPMRCPMRYEQTSTHALTRKGRRHTNISHINYRSTRHAHD